VLSLRVPINLRWVRVVVQTWLDVLILLTDPDPMMLIFCWELWVCRIRHTTVKLSMVRVGWV